MIKIENVITSSPEQWRAAIMGARNAMNSWDRSDGYCSCEKEEVDSCEECERCARPKDRHYILGPNDYELAMKLAKAGTDHRKFMRMITVYVDITAPLYW